MLISATKFSVSFEANPFLATAISGARPASHLSCPFGFATSKACASPVSQLSIPEKGKPDLKKLSNLTAQAVIKALESNSRVWIYPVSSLHGKKLAGMVAVSRDYLQEAVAETIATDPSVKVDARRLALAKKPIAG